jgi:peptidylprolyl isomerase
MKAAALAATACAVLVGLGCGGNASSSSSEAAKPASTEAKASTQRPEPKVAPPKGAPPRKLVVKDLIAGSGAPAEDGDKLTVEFVGAHYDGSPFTSSWEQNRPFKFELGAPSAHLSPAWEMGVPGMKAGGRRELIVPPHLLYEGGKAPPGTKPSETAIYVIDLIALTNRG